MKLDDTDKLFICMIIALAFGGIVGFVLLESSPLLVAAGMFCTTLASFALGTFAISPRE